MDSYGFIFTDKEKAAVKEFKKKCNGVISNSYTMLDYVAFTDDIQNIYKADLDIIEDLDLIESKESELIVSDYTILDDDMVSVAIMLEPIQLKNTTTDFDHILDITKKNALQMIEELKEYNYKEHIYTFKIKTEEPSDVEITITVDRSLYGGMQVKFGYEDKNRDDYPIPYVHTYYEDIDWVINDAADEFIESIKRQWVYDKE